MKRLYVRWDILIALIPLLHTKADRSRLMRSCKTLHEYILPFLARQGHAKSWEGIASLWDFVHSALERHLLIQELELPSPFLGIRIRSQFDQSTLARCGPFVMHGFAALDTGAYTLKQPDPELKLPWDILIHLLPLITHKADLSRVIRTCSTLHKYGLPILAESCRLPKVPSEFYDLWQSFALRFMKRHPELVLFIRDLELPHPDHCHGMISDRDYYGFLKQAPTAGIIAGASNLRTLRLHGVNRLAADNDIFQAILSHRSLERIEFGEIGLHEGVELIARMEGPVKKVAFNFGCIEYAEEERLPQNRQLVHLLQPFRETLEEVKLMYTPSEATLEQDLSGLGPQVRCTSVHTLVIDVGFMAGPITMDDISYVFPNLRTLVWRCEEDIDPEDAEDQRVIYDETQSHRGSWDILDTWTCDARWVFFLYSRFPVRLWNGVVLGRMKEHIHQFKVAIADIWPRHLDIAILLGALKMKWKCNLSTMFPYCEVTHLNIDMNDLSNDISRVKFKRAINELLMSLRRMPLRFLSIRFGFDQPSSEYSYKGAQCDAWMRDLDVAACIGRRLARHLPALKYVSFQFGQRQQPDACWRIGERTTKGTFVIERLSEATARKVLGASPFAKKLCSP
ncbi:hypothetical protein EIP91_007319 [Steccherinum ochraceum]|uniref:F-box domain-containing protein n=1 Tax=Steccherinum ochraceum TaxID=92696 RepID=A0A4R0RWE9_9APHY|nr:hypothetical protein EIP91_007319 [Steccherinum ochraceum]